MGEMCGNMVVRPHSKNFSWKHFYQQRNSARTLYHSVYTRKISLFVCANRLQSAYSHSVMIATVPIHFLFVICMYNIYVHIFIANLQMYVSIFCVNVCIYTVGNTDSSEVVDNYLFLHTKAKLHFFF